MITGTKLDVYSVFAKKLTDYLKFRVANGRTEDEHILYMANSFDYYCSENNITVAELTQQTVNGWFNYELKEGRRVCKGKVQFIRGFAKYLIMLDEKAYIADYSQCKIPPTVNPIILTDDEIRNLFREIDNLTIENGDEFAYKESFPAYCRLLLSCGLRPGEGRNIRRKDINYKTGEIYVRELNKRKMSRIIVAKPDVIEMLKKLDYKVSRLQTGSEMLFVNSNGSTLTTNQTRKWLLKCWRRANDNIPVEKLKSLRLYDFRHNFASINLYELGKETPEGRDPIALLKSYMGHANFSSTMYYMHLSPERSAKSFAVEWDKTMKPIRGDKEND